MGGSSAINYMIYSRGNRADYDSWPNLLRAFEELGYPNIDVDGEHQIGVTHFQTTSNNGQRVSANQAYIHPIRNERDNLVIKTQAIVTRIIIDPQTKTATGVEYQDADGQTRTATATKEVILSAGTIDSPRILKLSGIGPKEELEKLGIKVIRDAPVGENLQDHVTYFGTIAVVDTKTDTTESFDGLIDDLEQYQKSHRGPLSATGTATCGAFSQTKFEMRPEVPDLWLAFDGIMPHEFLMNPSIYPTLTPLPLSYVL